MHSLLYCAAGFIFIFLTSVESDSVILNHIHYTKIRLEGLEGLEGVKDP